MKIKFFTKCVRPLRRNRSNVFSAWRKRLDTTCPLLVRLLGGQYIRLKKCLRVFSVEDIRKLTLTLTEEPCHAVLTLRIPAEQREYGIAESSRRNAPRLWPTSASLRNENSVAIGCVCQTNSKFHLYGIYEEFYIVLRSKLLDALRAELDFAILKCHRRICVSSEKLCPCDLKTAEIKVAGFYFKCHLLGFLRYG